MQNRSLGFLITHLSWPLLFGLAILFTWFGFSHDMPIPTFLFTYTFLVITLLLLEPIHPFEKSWLESDGQMWNDIGHTLVNKGSAQALAISASAIGLKDMVSPLQFHGENIWPEQWPLFFQVILAVIAVDFVLYWAHRISHEWPFFWRFHALHHSVLKLWVVNTGRFHFVESTAKVLGLTYFMLLTGMPMLVIYWVSALTAYLGLLTHCNVEMDTSGWSWFINTPTLHRWHHSRDLSEGDKNYGENFMLWDHVFRSFFHPARRPTIDIGLNKGQMPPEFVAQLKWPFRN